ncbi:alpha/beta hydrolase [Streptacidiphilus pinicola]|uniref:Alpha/beta hydrolase n=1 Tax=Streptacidiphilus pinicola TaxID=2219663 RepID=A0A2X0IIJ4_9ACTN|nr:alpha/beta hydrolase [Streptacidiphilus pinicola]RAG83433.1 alpha/beta hydrolase [Streptacidiphilus pinicola]
MATDSTALAAWEKLVPRQVATNGIELRTYEAGEGTPVVLCHGFPELAFSWRHQITPLAEAGHHVIVPDLRGYGGSSRPADPVAYDIVTLCADLAGLLDALGLADAVFVGHDWGAVVVWHMALLHPDRVRAVAGLSVPPAPRAPVPPLGILRSRMGEDFYINWFQTPEPETALRADVRRTLLSRQAPTAAWAAGGEPAEPRYGWLTEDELALYVETFEATGFTGGLNYYRNIDRNWQLMEPLDGRTVDQPSFFAIGSKDPVGRFSATDRLDRVLTDQRGHLVLDGAGHWIQQQCPDEINAALLDFLGTL